MAKVVRHEPCPRCRELGNDTRGDNLAVYSDDGKHCFACGYHIFPNINFRLIPKVDHGPKSLLPSDFQREVPGNAWKWLLQYGLPYSYWSPHCGYSPAEQRLVFRVGDPLQFSIGRYVGAPGERGANKKWFVWGDCHKHCEVIGRGDSVVLVEDLISAHKVGQVAEAIPLFGTKVHAPVIYYLNTTNKPVVLWLDKDQEGTVYKLAGRLQLLFSRPIKVVITQKDPKCLDLQTIKEKLVYENLRN